MPRVFLGWLLLSYLLVVGAGMRVGRPEPRFSVTRPYVHSRQCQHANYLRLDCFERCNGEQTRVLKQLPEESTWHFLTQFKGLDVHFLAEARRPLAKPVRQCRHTLAHQPRPVPALAAGFTGMKERPPCRG